MKRPVALAAAALAVAVAVTVPASAATPKLIGTVGPGFTITLKLNGKLLKESSTVKAGSYLLVVTDKASSHNFVFEKAKGGTFEKTVTSVPFKGTKTLKVRLTPGKYEFYCRPHEKSGMKGEFTVR